MKECHICGKEFDPEIARDEFYTEYGRTFDYDNFRRPLCCDCAKSVIEEQLLGYYFAECENCGKGFDYCEDKEQFDLLARVECKVEDPSLTQEWEEAGMILCCDCAIEQLKKSMEDDTEF